MFAEKLLSGKPLTTPSIIPTANIIEAGYKEIFSIESLPDDATITDQKIKVTSNYQPIITKNIVIAINLSKNNAAAGLDVINLSRIKEIFW